MRLEVELREVQTDAIHLAEALRPVHADSRARVEAREVTEQPVGDEERRVVTGEEVDAIADVQLVFLLQRVLEDEIRLVQPVVVGPPAIVGAEVDPVTWAVRVAGESLLDPAVDLGAGGLERPAEPCAL